MKKKFLNSILIPSLLLNIVLLGFSFYLYKRYHTFALQVKYCTREYSDRNIVMIGNSITENWVNLDPTFFEDNKIANLGVGGDTSENILLRLRNDVLDKSYDRLILNVGINDICQSNYNIQFTINNILTILDLCKAHQIDLVLTSVLPTTEKFNPSFVTSIDIFPQQIEELNQRLQEIANANDLLYIDFYSRLDRENFINTKTLDGIHPNNEGYKVLENILLPYLDTLRLRE